MFYFLGCRSLEDSTRLVRARKTDKFEILKAAFD